jgi:hypothetical protein
MRIVELPKSCNRPAHRGVGKTRRRTRRYLRRPSKTLEATTSGRRRPRAGKPRLVVAAIVAKRAGKPVHATLVLDDPAVVAPPSASRLALMSSSVGLIKA